MEGINALVDGDRTVPLELTLPMYHSHFVFVILMGTMDFPSSFPLRSGRSTSERSHYQIWKIAAIP